VATTDLAPEQTAPAANNSNGLPAHDVADINLAPAGVTRIEWAEREMPVLRLIRQRFEKEQPLKGMRIGACLHVTTETANLMRTLKAGGADVALCASNLLSTQDDVAAALVAEYGISVFARRGVDRDGFYAHLNAVADTHPHLTQDDGCDLVTLLHRDRTDVLDGVLAGTEETTTGIIRLRAMAADGALKYPVVGVNESKTKHMFDNRFGTGQSTVDGILRATNILLAGRHVVVAGFGWVGKGIASRMRGMGAQVAIVEVDPIVAIEALMEGYQVLPGIEAAAWGEVFVTATGNLHVFRKEHFERMPNGAIMANSGHFDAELDLVALRELAGGRVRSLRRDVEEYDLGGGRKVYVLAQGRLVNLAAAEGHPAAVMDMSFANQALAAEYGAKNHASLSPTVHVMPDEIDREVARLKLEALNVAIDTMTPEQERYVRSWQEGT
jgi:adenosylhomocysteinase